MPNKFFEGKEIRTLVFASLILGFIISFRDWGYGEFSLAIGLTNLFRAFLLSFIAYSIYLIANKNAARLHGSKVEFKLWGMERFWFSKDFTVSNFTNKKIKTIKMGIILPLLLAFISNGFIKFATIAYSEITEIASQRAGKKYRNLTDFEVARIHLAGPFACLFIAVLLSISNSFTSLIEILKIVAIFSFIPVSKLDGAKILFSSFPIYLFGLLAAVGTILIMEIIPPVAAILLAIVMAIIILLIYLYRID